MKPATKKTSKNVPTATDEEVSANSQAAEAKQPTRKTRSAKVEGIKVEASKAVVLEAHVAKTTTTTTTATTTTTSKTTEKVAVAPPAAVVAEQPKFVVVPQPLAEVRAQTPLPETPDATDTAEAVKDWEDLDADDAHDPVMVSEYVVEIFEYMRRLEV